MASVCLFYLFMRGAPAELTLSLLCHLSHLRATRVTSVDASAPARHVWLSGAQAEICLQREAHLAWLKRGFTSLPPNFAGLDPGGEA